MVGPAAGPTKLISGVSGEQRRKGTEGTAKGVTSGLVALVSYYVIGSVG